MILQFQALIADTIGAFNTGFDTVNLLPRSTPSSWQAEGLYCEQRLERRIEHDFMPSGWRLIQTRGIGSWPDARTRGIGSWPSRCNNKMLNVYFLIGLQAAAHKLLHELPGTGSSASQ